MTFKVFISSSVSDIHIVNELKRTLERYGVQPIMPSEVEEYRGRAFFGGEIRSPPSITDKIKQLIRISDCVLVIIGRGGGQSTHVGFEIGVASALDKLIIPIVEEGSEIPKNLVDREYILIDRNRPKLSYERAAQYLNRLEIEKQKRNNIGGLLLLLAALASGD
jgi:nucleoside 2-deoxyribosyltransferase